MAVFTNQATLSYNNIVTNSNVATGQLLEVLSATKTPLVDTYSTNDKVTYVVSIINSGSTAVTGVTVNDDLGAYTVGTTTYYPLTYIDGSIQYYVNGVLQADPAVTAGPPLAISGISIPAGGNATIIYETAVNEYAPLALESSIQNNATVTGTGITTPAVASATVNAASEPDLAISKSVSPSTVTENSRLTYTFIIQNYGNTAADAGDNAIITDTFDPLLTDLAVAFNGTTWAEGTNYTYNETTGAFETIVGQITVPAATFTQDPSTGIITTEPGVSTLTITGTV